METIIDVKGVSKVFRRGFLMRRVKAVEDLNLEIDRGEIFGYLGPNGAGKTTTIKLLLGLIFPTKGKARLWGKEPNYKDVRARIGFLPEVPYFYDYLKVGELLQFYGRLFGMNPQELKRRIGNVLERVGLAAEMDVPLRQLSKGNIQRVGLAQALLNDPELLILDEPMSGLDPIGRRQVRDLMLKLREEGRTILFSSHILSDVETICDRVGILVEGEMRKIGPLNALLQPRVLGYEITIGGIDGETQDYIHRKATRIVSVGDWETLMEVREEDIDDVLKSLLQRGTKVVSVIPKKENLEEVFLKEVGKSDDSDRHHR